MPSDQDTPDCRSLFDSLPDIVLVTDAPGRIEEVNCRAREVLNIGPGDGKARHIAEFLPSLGPGRLGGIGKSLDERPNLVLEALCTPKDAAVFPSEVRVGRLRRADGVRLVFSIRDISAHKQAIEEALKDASLRLEQHDHARLQFVSNVSHELRTPLTSMTYAIHNMLSGVVGAVPDRVRHYLEILEADCKRLLNTINDILDLRKIESSTLSLAKRRIPFARLVRHSAGSLRVQAAQKNIDLSIREGSERWFVECDPDKMERVIINIVGNAIKFTRSGGTVEVSLDDDPERPRNVRLSIQDNGIGIPPEALDKVTVRYFTVGEQPTGAGLGLAISREIVTLHGGRLVLESPPPGKDRGTLVSVSLPVTDPPLVLLVDDDEGILTILEDQVSRQGYRVLKARGGMEALELIRQHQPEVVILDLVLPDFDGTELILKMKSEKALAPITIVVLTGADIGSGKAEILQSFSIPILAKPWDEAELVDHVAGAFFGGATTSRPARPDSHVMFRS